MEYQFSNYTGQRDLRRMLALAQSAPEMRAHHFDLPYRLASWAFDYPENVGLWESANGELAGWAVLQTPFWNVDFVLSEGANAGLFDQVMNWVDERARAALDTGAGRPCWFAKALRSQAALRAGLEAAGFRDQEHAKEDPYSQVLLRYAAGMAPVQAELPPGFMLRPLAGDGEVAAYVELHQQVFESKNMTEAWRLRTLQAADYSPELDLVIAAPDGSLAAFCIGWFSQHGREGAPAGQIEPLGVSPAFRRLGLGRALLNECVRRMRVKNAAQVYVITDNYRDAAFQLYTAAGFTLEETILMYRKDFEDYGP